MNDSAGADGVTLEPADANDPSYLTPPPGHSVRRPVHDDVPAIAALFTRAALVSRDGTTGRGALRTERDLERTWEERRNDALVVERDGVIVGYLDFHEVGDPWTGEVDLYAEGRVDAQWSDGELGTFLLDRARDRAERSAARRPGLPTELRTTVVDPTDAVLLWFAHRGMHEQRHLLQLRIDLGPATPTPRWHPGTRGVPGTEVGVEALHRALVASFADHHLGATDDLDIWRSVVLDRGRVDLSASIVALDEQDVPVGVALGRTGGAVDPGLGVITDLGVVPGWRGHGVATALLRAAFARFADLDLDRVGLEVDDVTLDGALRLYQRAGMEVVHHTVVLTTGPL